MVPGLSASSSSSSDQSTSRTLSRQESHCSTSSSSSSSSPTVTSSGGETREREDRIESDISPVTVSTKVDDRSRCVLKSRSGCKNSEKFWWMMKFLNKETHTPVLLMNRRIWVNTVSKLISLKTESARSVRGPKLQGPLAEDAMAEP